MRPVWTIRRTVLLLLLGVSLAWLVVFQVLWVPRVTRVVITSHTEELRRELDVIIDAILPFLLSRQFGAITETLSSIETRNANWIGIELHDQTGRRLFPLEERVIAMGGSRIMIDQSIALRGSQFGSLKAVIDLTTTLDRVQAETRRLGLFTSVAVIIIMALLTFAIDRLVTRRVSVLAAAADRMKNGDFEARLPDPHPDELGRLTLSFDAMRRQIRRQTDALQSARIEAETALTAKSQFLARMSHEIRTPLNGVIPVAELLADTHLTDEQADHVDTIREAGTALLSIVDDILDLSKFEEGRLELNPAPYNLSDLVNGVVRILRVTAESKGLRLEVDIAPDLLGVYLIGDSDRLRQVLINLTGNAVKFTRTGSVCIKVARTICDTGREELCISVIDTGIGIAEKDHARIFERFEQAEGGRNRRFGGSGLGLAIARSLIEAHGGQIRLTSEEGSGSRFDAMLPLNLATDIPQKVASETVPDSDLVNGRALVVDDNATNRKIIAAMLRRLGYRTDKACDGAQALNMIMSERFDIVLMDMHMPEMDGLEATRHIRSLTGLRARTRIIALTASVLEEDMRRCQEAGMDGFLSKPVSRQALAAALRAS